MSRAVNALTLMDMKTSSLSATAASCILAVSLLAGCGGEEGTAVCDDVDALRTSLTSLQAFDITDSNVLSDLSVVLDQVRTQVQQLADDASTEYAEEIDQVQTATDALESSAGEAVNTPSAANLSTLSEDVKAFGAAFRSLREAVGDTC